MNLCILMYVTFSYILWLNCLRRLTLNRIINKHTVRRPKTDNTLFNITTRGLLIKTLKVLGIPSMRYNFFFFRLEFVIAKSNDARYDIGAFLVGP